MSRRRRRTSNTTVDNGATAAVSRIPADVARKLGYYVYAYVNPVNDTIFYVGKGKGQRVLSHLQDTSKTEKAAAIRQITATGKLPEIHIVAHGLKDEQTALRIEGAVIDALGLPSLTNRVRGWKAIEFGRTPLRHVVAHYRRQPVTVSEPAVLIRINRLYRPTMTATELYDATRASWRVGNRRSKAKYAVAEFERARIQERVRAGLARAKAQGVRLDRPRRRIDPERLATVAGLPDREAARRLGIPRSTFQRLMAQNPTKIDA